MQYDIIIVGMGVVGNTAALLLAQQGLSVAIVERLPLRDTGIPKAGRIDGEAMRIFEQLGLRAEVEKLSAPLLGNQIVSSSGRLLVPFEQQTLGDFAPIYGIYQPELHWLLQRTAQRDKNISIFDQSEVVDILQNEHFVEIQARQAEQPLRLRLQGQYLLVCSGVHTPIAQLCNLKYIDYRCNGYTLNIDSLTQQPLDFPRYAQTIYDLPIPLTRITNSAHRQRWEFQIDAEHFREGRLPENVGLLIKDFLPADFQVESVFTHEFDSKVLRDWQDNRILFAGDAAHTMPPYLGMGLSAGIKDAYNLAWKLRLVCRQLAAPQLLASYKGERRPAAEQLINLNVWIQRIFQSSRLRFLRYLLPLLPKNILRRRLDLQTHVPFGIVGSHSAAKGRPVPHWPLFITNNQAPLDKILGPNFAIIGFDLNPVDAVYAQFIPILATLQCQFIQIVPKSQPLQPHARFSQLAHDSQGLAQQWFAQHKAQFAIVRPDRLVFDLAKDFRHLHQLLQNLCAKLQLLPFLPQKIARPTDHNEDEDILGEEHI